MKRDPRPTAARPGQRGPRRAAPSAAPAIDAAADVDRVVDAYCTMLLDKGFDDPEYWWWPRAVWVDPNQLIVDGENGNLYRVAFNTDDQQEITFQEPVEVLETFTDVPAAAKARIVLSTARDVASRAPVRVFASREDTPAPPKTESEGGVGEGSNNVGMTPEQLKAIGLPADATQEQIDARLGELTALETGGEGGENAGDEGGEPTPTGGEGGENAGEENAGEDGGEPAASAQLPDGMVAIPAETWEQVQTNAAAGAQVAEDAEVTNRDNTINAAMGEGKIPPSQRDAMVNLHTRDKDSFYKLLTASVKDGGLMPGLVPVQQRGGARATAAGPAGVPATPGGQVPAEAGGEYVPPEKMRALFGDAFVPATPNQAGVTVVGAQV